MSRPRIRQHVNPLNFRGDVEVPDWNAVFARPEQPIEVDIGCAHGDFLIARAKARQDLNLVGLEIRKPMVERVQKKIDREELDNAALVYCNANTSLTELFPADSLQACYVHHPDPWFKKKHHKRRIMTRAFVEALATVLVPGGRLRFQTDHGAYAEEVEEMMAGVEAFEPCEDEPGLPLTHREEWHAAKGDTIHRMVWKLV